MSYVGSCGETSERTAGRFHTYAVAIMGLCVVLEIGAALLHAVMCAWHRASVTTHDRRAVQRGE